MVKSNGLTIKQGIPSASSAADASFDLHFVAVKIEHLSQEEIRMFARLCGTGGAFNLGSVRVSRPLLVVNRVQKILSDLKLLTSAEGDQSFADFPHKGVDKYRDDVTDSIEEQILTEMHNDGTFSQR